MPRNQQLYCLQEEQDGKWVRISEFAYPKAHAVRVFQTALLMPYMNPDATKGKRRLSVTKRREVKV